MSRMASRRTKPRTRFGTRLVRLEDRITPALTTSFDHVNGAFSVTSDAADPIVVAADPPGAGHVRLNGADALDSAGQKVLGREVRQFVVTGGPGANMIDLRGIAGDFGLLD